MVSEVNAVNRWSEVTKVDASRRKKHQVHATRSHAILKLQLQVLA
jgi:hypothetical protein